MPWSGSEREAQRMREVKSGFKYWLMTCEKKYERKEIRDVQLFEKRKIIFMASKSTTTQLASLWFTYTTSFLPKGSDSNNSVKRKMDLRT